jgi:uncharacterized repeat protein (TIGR01451 family)
VENTATVTSATGDSDLRNNSSTTTVDVGVVADVSIDKSLETTPVVSGQPATFRLSVTNAGPATAPDVTTSDTLPPGTVFVSAEAALGCVSDRQEGLVVVTCSLGALAPGDTASSTLTLLAPTTGALTNVGSAGSGALDPCPEDGVCAAGDDRGNVDSVTFEVVNRPPVATDDLDVLAVSGVPLTIDVLANDFEPDGEPLEVVAVGAPQAGSAELGSVIYTSDSEYIGTDQFTYTVCDPGGLCDEGLVTLTIVAAPTEAQPPPGTSDPPSERGETFGGGQQGALAATGLPLTTWIGLGVLFLAGGILVRWASVPGRARLDRSRRRDRREIRCGA